MSEELKPTQESAEGADLSQQFLAQELESTKKALQNTQVWGTMVVFGVMCFLFSIANGFATNFEPKEAAKIAKGLVVQRLDEAQPQISSYLGKEIPAWIESVPEYAKDQLPIVREDLEATLEDEFEKLAGETSEQLDVVLDQFLIENQDQFKTIILAGQDKETTDEVARELRSMFIAYLTTSENGEESIQDKLDKSLVALRDVERKTSRLANAKDLDATEKKTRRAIACLFQTVEQNKDAWNLPTKEEVQGQVSAVLEAAEASTPR